MSAPETKTSPLVLALAWLVVMVPLGWGVFESVKKSLPLFAATERAQP
jgi:hypothetical protein